MHQLRKRFLIAVLVLVIMPLSAVQAKPFGFGPAFGPGGGGPKGGPGLVETGPEVIADLNLSSEQIERLRKKKIAQRKTMIKLHSQLQVLRVDLAEAANRENPDMRTIETMSRQIGDIHGQMTAERIKSVVYLRSILNDEQKKIMDAHRLEFGTMGSRKMGGRWR